jgi:Ca-activated chloride channel family protein
VFLFDLSFAFPWAFLILPLLLALPRARDGRLFRWLSLATLTVALAQPEIRQPSDTIALLIDVSDSIGNRGRYAAKELGLSPNQADPQVYFFAQDTTRVSNTLAEVPGFLETATTDLARALQVVSSSEVQRVLLISDGAESTGKALLALPDIPVDVLRIKPQPNVRMAELLAPNQAAPGETIEIIAIIETDRAARILLRPEVAGQTLKTITMDVLEGQTSIPFQYQIQGESTIGIKASFDVNFPQPIADDSLEITVAVEDKDPVLVLGDPALANLLTEQGLEVREGTVAEVTTPLRYSAVILRESAGEFTPGQLNLLRSYVENGGGLMMTGGPFSFGFGSWYRTPVEEVLPVSTDLRTDVTLPLVAMVIIMDRSQSMGAGSPSKIDLAKEGAISVVDLAYQEDLLGLIAFSDESFTEWIFELRPATERGKLEMLQSILAITTRGGTVLGPAYEEGLRVLSKTTASLKHIIVLSDGKLYDNPSSSSTDQTTHLNQMAANALAEKITTSTIAIGASADFDVLEAIAVSGGGRYYKTLDTDTLPQIFTNEALTATRSLLRDDPFQPRAHHHPLATFNSAIPPPDAYIASTLKAESEMLIEGLGKEPLLAVRHHGLGRTAALTTDLNLWAGEFGTWDQLPLLLGTIVRWLQASPEEFTVYEHREGNQLQVVVDAIKDGAYVNNRNLIVRYLGIESSLNQVAPGRYEGYLPLTGPSGTLLVINNNEVVARKEVSTTLPEFDREGADQILEQLASRTTGIIYDNLVSYAPISSSSAISIWPYLAMAGMTIFLVELVVRRFGRSAND